MMRTVLLASLLLALPLSAMPAQAADAPVTLTITLSGAPYKTCTVTVPLGANAGTVLDAAVNTGCIGEWSFRTFRGYGRYVTSIDNVAAEVETLSDAADAHQVPVLYPTFWAFYYNSATDLSPVGIDGTHAAPGDAVRFDYRQWLVPT